LHVTINIVQIIAVTQATKVSKVCGPIVGTFNSTDGFGHRIGLGMFFCLLSFPQFLIVSIAIYSCLNYFELWMKASQLQGPNSQKREVRALNSNTSVKGALEWSW
jgi:hypothetical protein